MSSTPVSIQDDVLKRLFDHKVILEKNTGKSFSYTKTIEFLLEYYKETIGLITETKKAGGEKLNAER